MTIRPLLLCLALAAAAPTPAASQSGGSTYSLLALGDLRAATGTRGAGMGGTGIGLSSRDYVSGISPAAWHRLERTRLDVGIQMEGFRTTDGVSQRYLSRADFAGVSLALPLWKEYGMVLVAAVSQYSNVDYDLYTRDTSVVGPDTMAYAIHHSGVGGLQRGRLGLSFAPASWLALGASFDYLFGTIEDTWAQIPASPAFTGGSWIDTQRLRAPTATVSALFYGLENIAAPLRPLSVGVMATTGANAVAYKKTVYQFTEQNDTSEEVATRQRIPALFGVGLSYQLTDRIVLAADYVQQQWAGVTFDQRTPTAVRNSRRFGLGAERTALPDPLAPWGQRVAYRLGLAYQNSLLSVNGQPIDEFAATAGLSVPLVGETIINVAFSVGTRGTTEAGLVRDTIYRLGVTLSVGDTWFVRQEED